MTQSDEELSKVIGSHLVKAGVHPMTASALIKTAIVHRDMTKRLMDTMDQEQKMNILGNATDMIMNMLLVQLFHSAEASGLEVGRMNSVLISVMLSKAATGCLLSTDTEDDARDLFKSVQAIAFDKTVEITELFKEHLEMLEREKKNASIH
jgi:hypothetical protein